MYDCQLVMLLDVAIVVLSLYGYLSQLLLLRKQTDIGTFSILVTAVIILSSLLKMFFYFFQPYALNLLVQNILLIILHLFIIRECLRVSRHTHSLTDLSSSAFWKWKNFTDYIWFIVAFSGVLAVLTWAGLRWELGAVGAGMGLTATAIEIMLGVPQIVSSWRSKSVSGVSLTMIGMWLFCDGLKTYYFIANDQPLQFILTGAIQIVLDFVILLQIALYTTPQKSD